MRTEVSAAIAALAAVLAGRDAMAFCRTMTCPLPPDFSPSAQSCIPQDFDSYCASLDPPAKTLPVWWRNACVGYDVQQNASQQVPYAMAAQIAAQSFAKWTSLSCPDPGGGSYRLSIDVRDLGPVACDLVQYNSDQGNQHVIIFHDDVWPHNDANNTLGLTTVTFDPDTGEIYDADMEINATVPLAISDPVPPDGYDLQSIITHEAGHFLGMAHSGDDRATMYASYAPGTTFKRTLTEDDVSGICSIYLPGGLRAVDPSTTSDGNGTVPEDQCDPTPRHGFSPNCASAPKHTCAVASPGAGQSEIESAAFALALAASCALLRRRRPPSECDT
jgi:hypothetical protein